MKKIKNIMAALLFALAIYSSSSPVLAEREDSINNFENNIEESKQPVERRESRQLQFGRAERESRLTAIKKARIRLYFSRMTTRIKAAVGRLERLIARIESRLGKIESADKGISTTDIRLALEEAKLRLNQTRETVTHVQSGLEEVLKSDEPREAFAYVMRLVREIKEQLVQTHLSLVNIISEIKGLRVGN